MEKQQSVKPQQRQLATSELRVVAGGAGRLRVPTGYTDTGEPIYTEDGGDEGDAGRIRIPIG